MEAVTVMRTKRIVWLLAALALAGALAATHGDGCDPLDGIHHSITSCPAAILPPQLFLGLVLLSLITLTSFDARPQFVPGSIDRPPRLHRAR